MRSLRGTEVRQAVRGRWLSRDQHKPVTGVTIDSRTASPGDLFIAVRGDRFDGHDFLLEAAEKGCVAAVVEFTHAPIPEIMSKYEVGVIGVADTTSALLDLGGYYRSVIPGTVVAVTGSNGKTTVREMINHILSTRFTGTTSHKNYNNHIGVPLTILSAGAGDDYLICEAGTSSPGEIPRLARAIKADVGVITSISEAHLEGFNSVEQIAIEKMSLFNWLEGERTAVANIDSPELARVLRGCDARLIRFGRSPDADLRLTDYQQNGLSQRFQINGHQYVEMSVPGIHNALNGIAAMATCARFGFSFEDSAEILSSFKGVPMRLEHHDFGSIKVINDAYNANPASMNAAIEVMLSLDASRRVAVIGDMLELGSMTEAKHNQVGTDLASRGIDLVIGVGELGSVVARSAASGHATGIEFADIGELRKNIGNLITEGDLVLLKGSRAMALETLVPDIRNLECVENTIEQDNV